MLTEKVASSVTRAVGTIGTVCISLADRKWLASAACVTVVSGSTVGVIGATARRVTGAIGETRESRAAVLVAMAPLILVAGAVAAAKRTSAALRVIEASGVDSADGAAAGPG